MKKSIKKLFLLILSFSLMLTIIAEPVSANPFSDAQGHWAQASIDKWSEYGVINGYEGKFRPNDSISRAEFATIINNIMKYIEQGENKFSDLDTSKWYYDTMVKLNTAGVLNGVDGKALPEHIITRQEAAVLIANAFKINGSSGTTSFKDEAAIADWAKTAVSSLVEKEVLGGFPDKTFKPHALLTRAEAVAMFSKLIGEFISKPGEYSKDVEGNVVVNSTDTVLKDMKIAGDLYITQGVGDGEVTLENVEVTGNVYVFGGGENSIIFNSVDVSGALIVNRYNGKVRVLATGDTSVNVTRLESGALLVTKELTGGGFETVEIPANIVEGHEIVLDGSFNKVINQSEAVDITVNGEIKELVAEANTSIEGNVTVNKVTTADGTTATVNDSPILESTNSNPAPSSGGSNDSNDSDASNSTVYVTSVSINENNLSLTVGETKQLSAVVQPSNAANKSVQWKVEDGSTDVVTVDQNGLVTAIAEGSKVIKVVTGDGGKTDRITVTVEKSEINLSVEKFAGATIDSNASIADAIIANSGNLSIQKVEKSVYKDNFYDAMIVANQGMQAVTSGDTIEVLPSSQDPSGNFANVVITLKDSAGNPISDTAGITATAALTTSDIITVTGYTPNFGNLLAEDFKEGSFVATIDAGNPESIQHIQLVFSKDNYADTTLSMIYVPQGTAYIKGIETITGGITIGSTLTAGQELYEGTPVNENVTYKWLRADSAAGPYTVIEGATAAVYELTETDSGKYIRVEVSADQTNVAGSAVSAAFGTVEEIADANDVYSAIEAAFLAGNKDQNNITFDLNLMTEISQYPNVTITWSSDNESAITNQGVVTRSQENDQFVNLTATLTGDITGTKTYHMIVRSNGTDSVDIVNYTDPYFAEGYPQSYIKNGEIWVKFKLKQPAEVFMVVNAMNGHTDTSVKSVIEGHAGLDNNIVWVDEWPYFKVDNPEQIYDFNTGAALRESLPAKIEFAIKDSSQNYSSSNITTILFDQQTVSALDTTPPHLRDVYLNNALNAIYLYYSEPLDLTSVPTPDEFTLNVGTVENVALYNYEQRRAVSSYVKLGVSGITESDKNNLTVSYTGTSIQDTTDAKNKAETVSAHETTISQDKIESVTISSDRKSMIVNIVEGWNPPDNTVNSSDLFVINVAGFGDFTPASTTYSYNTNHMSYQLSFDSSLPTGTVTVKVKTAGIKNWAMDSYPTELVSQTIQEIPAPGTPTAVYTQNDDKLKLTFEEGFRFDYSSFNAAGLVLKIDNIEYSLRGFIISNTGRNEVIINLNDTYSTHFKNAVEAGLDVSIKYNKVNGDARHQLSDEAGALIPDFNYLPILKQ